MVRKLTVIQLPDNSFVQSWDYSQGHFDFTTTHDLLRAENFTSRDVTERFLPFFTRHGGILREYEVTVTSL